jgi:hypothetical protein
MDHFMRRGIIMTNNKDEKIELLLPYSDQVLEAMEKLQEEYKDRLDILGVGRGFKVKESKRLGSNLDC